LKGIFSRMSGAFHDNILAKNDFCVLRLQRHLEKERREGMFDTFNKENAADIVEEEEDNH